MHAWSRHPSGGQHLTKHTRQVETDNHLVQILYTHYEVDDQAQAHMAVKVMSWAFRVRVPRSVCANTTAKRESLAQLLAHSTVHGN